MLWPLAKPCSLQNLWQRLDQELLQELGNTFISEERMLYKFTFNRLICLKSDYKQNYFALKDETVAIWLSLFSSFIFGTIWLLYVMTGDIAKCSKNTGTCKRKHLWCSYVKIQSIHMCILMCIGTPICVHLACSNSKFYALFKNIEHSLSISNQLNAGLVFLAGLFWKLKPNIYTYCSC